MEKKQFVFTLTEDQILDLFDNTKVNIEVYKERPGQALFNALITVENQIANRVRNTNFDPFYNSKNISICLKSIFPLELQAKYIHQFVQLA